MLSSSVSVVENGWTSPQAVAIYPEAPCSLTSYRLIPNSISKCEVFTCPKIQTVQPTCTAAFACTNLKLYCTDPQTSHCGAELACPNFELCCTRVHTSNCCTHASISDCSALAPGSTKYTVLAPKLRIVLHSPTRTSKRVALAPEPQTVLHSHAQKLKLCCTRIPEP